MGERAGEEVLSAGPLAAMGALPARARSVCVCV